ncbi:MAG: outer membrane protein assembly factor BamD [Bacteroidota bacterium]
MTNKTTSFFFSHRYASSVHFLVVLFVSAFLVGCSAEEALQQLPVEERFEIGMQKFMEEDYADAEKEFRIVTLQFQGTAYADDAQFYLGECQYMLEQYILAAYEYEVLIRSMPTSPLVARARHRRAMCYYHLSPDSFRDQEYTLKAVDEFQAFIEYFPTDTLVQDAEGKIQELISKLAQKEYDNGILYMRLESYKAAIYYFDLILEKYHDTPYAEKAQLQKAEALFLRKRYSESKAALDRFIEKYPESVERARAQLLLNDVQSKLTGSNEPAANPPPATPNPVRQY